MARSDNPRALPNPPRRREEGLVAERSGPVARDGASSLQGTDDGSAPTPAVDDWRERLETRLRLLPRQSGVYVMRDLKARVLYVGKAKQLHQRVRSYFRGPKPEDPRLQELRRRIRTFDYLVTAGESEALVLETNLIKQYSPPFNVRLKDDKKYPYLKITTGHEFPALWVTRNVAADGSRYFGPFTQVKDLRRCLKTLRAVFQLRNCSDRRLIQGGRECLQFFIGACSAPCTARVDRHAYGEQVEPLLALLSGRSEEVLARLRERMRGAASELRFEESARLRDGIGGLELLVQEQRMTPPVDSRLTVVGLALRGNRAAVVLLRVDEGKVLGKSQRLLTGVAGRSRAEVLRSFVLAEFLAASNVPRTLVCPIAPQDRVSLERILGERVGHPVTMRSGARGELRGLLAAAEENAHLALEEEELFAAAKTARVAQAVYELQSVLALEKPPYRIEGYDISNFQGSHPVASRVVFQDGKPLKAAYRRLRMNHVPGPDDFAMIGEAVRRRLEKLQDPREVAPDLILVDGGIGQVARAKAVLEEMGFSHLALAGLAKKEEEVVLPQGGQPLRLPRNSEALRLLQRVRDEAHRFAVGYHRKLRTKAQKHSELDQIRGIGPKRRRLLLRRFGSIDALRSASEADLAALPGFGVALAQAVKQALVGPSTDEGGGA